MSLWVHSRAASGNRRSRQIRSTSDSGHRGEPERPPFSANSRSEQVQQIQQAYSITSSASESRLSETLTPSALAVLTLITNSNLVGCRIGRSAGLAPLRILPA